MWPMPGACMKYACVVPVIYGEYMLVLFMHAYDVFVV